MTRAQVLVVEDNEKNMKLARDVLQASGYRVLEATTGAKAVELATEHEPDLVLMDIHLPDIDGVEAVGRLRADERTASIPVLALTAQAMRGDRERFLAEGFDGYLSKPIDVKTFSQEVARYVVGPDRKTSGAAKILVVDDMPANVRLIEATLTPRGYEVIAATSGEEALEAVARHEPALVLLDVQMPNMNGYEVCRRLRANETTRFLPVVMVTSSGEEERVTALEAGADDFISKAFDKAELLARVRSLIRIKEFHDRIQSQAVKLTEINRTLEERVESQVDELERLGRLRRFLAPALAEAILADESVLESHRREIAALFCDLRGWTHFSSTTEPEEVMGVIRQFHDGMGSLIHKFEATVGFFQGDGIMVWFNDPIATENPAERAVTLATEMCTLMTLLTTGWRKRGHELDLGVGLALGYATLGTIGFEGRYDYGAVGSVMNLASRLSDEAGGGEILIDSRAHAEVESLFDCEPAGELTLKGFAKPVPAFRVRRPAVPAGS